VNRITLAKFLLMAAFGAGIAQSSVWAESIKFKYTKSGRVTLTSQTSFVGDVAGNELIQAVHLDAISSSGPGIRLLDERAYEQAQQIAGTGTHRGFSVNTVFGGDQLFQRWEGTHTTSTKSDGSWETHYSGRSEIFGGTGKYLKAKGNCQYVGRVNAQGLTEEDDCTMQY